MGLGINSNEYDRSAPEGSVLPPDVYTMTIVRIQQKRTKDETGLYIETEFDIQSPSRYSNRKFWDNFNITNKSADAQRIGRENLSDLWKAAGLSGTIDDEQMLLGKSVQARLYVKESDNPKYPDRKNKCRKYYPVGVDADAEDKKKKSGAQGQQIQPGVTQPSGSNKANWNTAGQQQATASQQVGPDSALAGDATKEPWKR